MLNSTYGSNVRIVPIRLLMLKHREFKPQLTGVLETRFGVGTLNTIQETLDKRANIQNLLNIQLANSLDVNLSKGRIANTPNGWREEKFSFLLVVEVYSDNVLVSEEIYQGYTDKVDTVGGRLEAGSSVTIAPDTMMYVNRVMEISYAVDHMGNRIPSFSKSDSLLAENTNDNLLSYGNNNDGLLVMRPMDIALEYHNNAVQAETENVLNISNSNNFNKLGKFSKTDNEVGGRTLTKLINSANRSKLEDVYSFDSSSITQYEHMLSDLVENTATNYKLLRYMGINIGVSQLSRWTVADLHKFFPTLKPEIFTVESYNDAITKSSNALFQLGNTNDLGDDVLVDNQLSRFQKRIVPYLFDCMLSYGFIRFSGRITNKTLDGSIDLAHSLLMNVSNTVNADPKIREHLLRLLYAKLTDYETKSIFSNDNTQAVEIVFDLSLTDSNLFINLNGHITKVKVPSLCDNTFSSLIMDSENSKHLITELKTVVSTVLKPTESSASSGW
jgi:hypothetical protein